VNQPPEFYQLGRNQHPEVFAAYESLAAACRSGPLDARAISLVKLSLSIGAGLEGAVHSATRKALEAGCKPEELHHVAILATTTLGFPAMMRARAWINDVIERASSSQPAAQAGPRT